MLTPATQTAAFAELIDRYGAAWDAGDVDAIMALQTEDITFELCIEGYTEVVGAEAVADMFGYFIDAWKAMRFEPVRAHFGDDLYVNEYRFTGELVAPLPLLGTTVEPNGRTVDVAGVDVITARDGLVATKRTYLDALALHAQMTA